MTIFTQLCSARREGRKGLPPTMLKGSDLPRSFLCLGDRCHKQIKDICLNSFNVFVFVSWLPSWLWGLSSHRSLSFLSLLFLTIYSEWLQVPWVTGQLTKMATGHFQSYCLIRISIVYFPSGCWNLTAALSPSWTPHLKWSRTVWSNRFDMAFFFFNMVGSICRNVFWYQVTCRKLLVHPQTFAPSLS